MLNGRAYVKTKQHDACVNEIATDCASKESLILDVTAKRDDRLSVLFDVFLALHDGMTG